MCKCAQNFEGYDWHVRNHADDAPPWRATIHHIMEAIWHTNRALEDVPEDGVRAISILKAVQHALYTIEESIITLVEKDVQQ